MGGILAAFREMTFKSLAIIMGGSFAITFVVDHLILTPVFFEPSKKEHKVKNEDE